MPRPIVTITHEFFPQIGGIGTYVAELAKAAHSLDFPIEIWATANAGRDVAEFPFPVYSMPVKGTQGWSDRIRLAIHVNLQSRRLKNSLVCLPEPGPLRAWMYMQFLKRFQPSGLITILHGSEVANLTRWTHRRLLFYRLLMRCDRIGVVSHFVRELVIHHYPELETRIALAPGAPRTDIPYLDAIGSRRNRPGRVVLLTVGRIHPRKGQLAVIEALAQLTSSRRQSIEYRIAGPVSHSRYCRLLRRTASEAGVRLAFLGALTARALREAYADADIFVMTPMPLKTSIEGFGLGYIEASAAGLAVIGHAVGGTTDAVKHNETGLLVDPHDRTALAETIIKLVDDESLRTRLGRAGVQWASQFRWENTARTLFDGLA